MALTGPRGVALSAAAAVLASLALMGCSARDTPPGPGATSPGATSPRATSPGATGPGATSPATLGPDPPTAAALVRIAQAFNDAYDDGAFGSVYDRWDARSQALISRAEYIRRHAVCAPATHQAARVEDAVRAAGGGWHVHYELGGTQLTDTWYYQRRRWVFDIIASNPDAARLYRMTFRRYAVAVGCSTH